MFSFLALVLQGLGAHDAHSTVTGHGTPEENQAVQEKC